MDGNKRIQLEEREAALKEIQHVIGLLNGKRLELSQCDDLVKAVQEELKATTEKLNESRTELGKNNYQSEKLVKKIDADKQTEKGLNVLIESAQQQFDDLRNSIDKQIQENKEREEKVLNKIKIEIKTARSQLDKINKEIKESSLRNIDEIIIGKGLDKENKSKAVSLEKREKDIAEKEKNISTTISNLNEKTRDLDQRKKNLDIYNKRIQQFAKKHNIQLKNI